jgi:NAD(P)-dependent dehydrogenase (short-subunit alcohol dehydrogenase family)
MQLKGKTALVTGGAKRVGRATALALAAEKVDVVVHYHESVEEAESLVEEIRAAGTKARSLGCDLSVEGEASALFERAVDTAGPIDILINNASIFPVGGLTDVDAAALELNMQIHALSPLALARALAAQGRPAHIVNFLDTKVLEYDRDHVAYHLSKRVLSALTRILAMELAPAVAVNAVAPGLILPPPGKDQKYLEEMASTNPLQRHGSPRDLTDAVLFLLRSRFITGQLIFVDGGRHMKGRFYE